MSSSSATPPDTIMVGDALGDRGMNGHSNGVGDDGSGAPKAKRLACMVCRKRKLKCDGTKPSCSTCSRLGHTCAYDEVRRKSGPKRGYVKALEERLRQVETLLKTQDGPSAGTEPVKNGPRALDTQAAGLSAAAAANFAVQDPSLGVANGRDKDRWGFNPESPQPGTIEDFGFGNNLDMNQNFTWEMIGLGLEEPLPPQETIDELHQIFFEKIHPSIPMIHKYRYLAAMNLAPNQRPPVCLRYAMWTLACSVTEKYSNLKDLFYQRARKYVEGDYVKGYGEHMISVAHTQTHILLASYEFKMMYFPRAWMSTGAAVRLGQMIGLHRMDGAGLDVKECLPPPRDWTEREERRRTFWMAFCEDRYASIGTGWPMTIDERDIMTNLPASDEAFDMSRPEQAQSLPEAMSPAGAGKLSSFGGIVLMACLFGRNLTHLHRPDADDRDHDLNGEFWKRHRNMDNVLLNTSLCLPSHLKLPSGLTNPNIIFTNMCIHTSTICLHQAAIFKADKNRLPATVSAESKVRCITAANEIASIMRMISHMDLAAMNPFISFCLYVAARVFVQYLKSRPDDSQTADSLRFLLSAMSALKRRNPLTESFLVQLDVDLEALGARIPKLKAAFPRSTDSPAPKDAASDLGKAPCDDPEGTNGIMAYRNECNFLKLHDDDGNAATGPNLVEPDRAPHGQPDASAGGLDAPTWLTAEPIQLPSRERSSGPSAYSIHSLSVPSGGPSVMTSNASVSAFGQSESASMNDMSTPPDGSASNRPTPNSSSASEQRHNLSTRLNGGSGVNSFEASPASSHQNLGVQQPGSGEADQNANAFYGNPGAFNMAGPVGLPGLAAAAAAAAAQDQRFTMPGSTGGEFAVPAEWAMPSQPGMTPVAEGVLRSIMQMGPMETMDLGWDANP